MSSAAGILTNAVVFIAAVVGALGVPGALIAGLQLVMDEAGAQRR